MPEPAMPAVENKQLARANWKWIVALLVGLLVGWSARGGDRYHYRTIGNAIVRVNLRSGEAKMVWPVQNDQGEVTYP